LGAGFLKDDHQPTPSAVLNLRYDSPTTVKVPMPTPHNPPASADLERRLREQTAELSRRDAILEAVAFAAERFLKGADWQANMGAVLERLGQKTGASHVYVSENHLAPDGTPATSLRYEWTAPGLTPDIDNPIFQNVPIREEGFERWADALTAGEPFYGNLKTFSPAEAEFMAPRGIKSLLDVPIYIGATWWGIIGFDDCVTEREWSPAEVDALKAAAAIISAAIQRQRADAALRESERLYRKAIEAADAVPYLQTHASADDESFTFAFIGEGIRRLTGYGPEEMTFAVWQAIVQESVMRGEGAGLSEADALQRSRAGGAKAWWCDYRIRTRDGQIRWIADTAVEILNAQGLSEGSIGILQDITERKQVEATLSEQAAEITQLYRASARLSEAAPDVRQTAERIADIVVRDFGFAECGVWLIRQDGAALQRLAYGGDAPDEGAWDIPLDGPGLMVVAVQAAESLYVPDVRLEPRYLLGDPRTRSELVMLLRTRERIVGVINIESPEPDAFSERQRRTLAAFAEQAALALENAQLVISLERAVQEVQRLNAELEARVLQRTAELEAANKELESFSYSVSHDLRAPLRTVAGFARILAEDYASALDASGQLYLRKVRDGAHHMSQLIDDLLDFSRLGRKPLKVRALSPDELSDMVQTLVDDLRAETPGRQVELTLHSLPPCRADPGLLRQVFANLLGNAFKYSHARERARIEVGHTGEAYFVRDNGVGFDMRYAGKLFGVFQRLHGVEQFEGAGVGLAIVQRIVQRHGGRVWAEAEVDKGATFYFTLV
jgi:PAS domain S-box-containing protein